MQEQLVSFETALLAKEKGFIQTETFYGISSSLIYDVNKKAKPSYQKTQEDEVDAPTQSLLQKWLRERHGIQTEISMGVKYINDKLTNLYSYSIFSCSPQLKINWKFSYKKPITYEEALEAGLLEALKQIK